MEQFDIFVIGGGPGGYVAALEGAKQGQRVALAEADMVGGTCLNRGCIPTKSLLRSARLYRECCNGGELGVTAREVSYSMEGMHSQAEKVMTQLRSGVEGLLERARVTVIRDRATVAAPGVVEAGGQQYMAKNIIIATGSSPARPPIKGLELPGVVTSDQMLETIVDCKRLVIIGGGVVGVEFAQIYGDLGCQVTVLEAAPRLLPSMDRELAASLAMTMKKRGIELHTGAMVQMIDREGEGLCCRFTEKEQERTVSADRVLVCTGRVPNTAGLFPQGMELNMQRGYIPVDSSFSTAVPGIYAIGDVVLGGMQLAHAAEAGAKNAVSAICGRAPEKVMAQVPGCVFTQPEIASVGLTADEAKTAGRSVTATKGLTSANGKAVIEGADRGFVKLIADSETGVLLGAQLICPHASEMVGGLAAAINSGMTLEQLRGTIFPHPTVSETIIG